MGVRDPWALELAPLRPGALAAAFAKLIVAAPLAAIGAVMGWIPYRLAGEVAKRITRDEDVLGTAKLFAGVAFLAVAWGLEATAAGFAWGAGWAAPTFLAGVATGYVALRFEELRREAAEAWRLVVLRAFHHQTTQRLAERRRALADAVAQRPARRRRGLTPTTRHSARRSSMISPGQGAARARRSCRLGGEAGEDDLAVGVAGEADRRGHRSGRARPACRQSWPVSSRPRRPAAASPSRSCPPTLATTK